MRPDEVRLIALHSKVFVINPFPRQIVLWEMRREQQYRKQGVISREKSWSRPTRYLLYRAPGGFELGKNGLPSVLGSMLGSRS